MNLHILEADLNSCYCPIEWVLVSDSISRSLITVCRHQQIQVHGCINIHLYVHPVRPVCGCRGVLVGSSAVPTFPPKSIGSEECREPYTVKSVVLAGPKGLVINYGEGGLQNGKIAGPKLFAPPPQDRVKLFAPPLLKCGNFTRPPLQYG